MFSMMIDQMHAIKQNQRREVMSYLQIRAPHEEMADARYIAFANGVLDLETGLLQPNTPDLLIPNVIPHNWNPEAFDRDYRRLVSSYRELPSHPRVILIAPIRIFRNRSNSFDRRNFRDDFQAGTFAGFGKIFQADDFKPLKRIG